MTKVLCYGGGRQTTAMILLCHLGELEWPDRIIFADTTRERRETMEYYERHTRRIVEAAGKTLEIAGHELATVDLYAHNGQILLPVYHDKHGKFNTYCSGEWKNRVLTRYLRSNGITTGERWIGYGYEETRRYSKVINKTDRGWTVRCPLVDRKITTPAAMEMIARMGWPQPPQTSCWCCPHITPAGWRRLAQDSPEEFARAIDVDEELRQYSLEQLGTPVYLSNERRPLRELPIVERPDHGNPPTKCVDGHCFT